MAILGRRQAFKPQILNPPLGSLVVPSTGGGGPATLILPDDAGTYVDPTCPVNWAHPLNIGRIAWWRVTGNPGWRGSLTLRDLVRGGHTPHDGVLSGTTKPVWNGPKGLPGSAGTLLLDGVSGYVDCGTSTAIQPTAAGTIAAWVKLTSVAGNAGIVSWEEMSAGRNGATLYHSNSFAFGCELSNGTTYVALSGSLTPAAGKWYRVGFTWDGATMTLYVNGVKDASKAQTLTPTNGVNHVCIGRNGGGSNFFLPGAVDDAAIWNRALTAQEIAADYNLSRQGYPDALSYLSPIAYSFPLAPPPTVVISGGYPATIILPDDAGTYVDPTCPVNWAHPLNIGRIAWWKITANPGWRGGLTLRDLVRGGHTPHDGALGGTTKPTWGGAKGLAGAAGTLTFDGTSGYVAVPNQPVFQPGSGPFTLTAWLRSTASTSNTQYIFWLGSAGGGSNFPLIALYTPATGGLGSTVRDASNTVGPTGGTGVYADNRWHHAALTRSGNTVVLYLDGVVVGTVTGTLGAINPIAPLFIGTAQSLGVVGSYFKGQLDDVSLWNRALSVQEIAAIYSTSRQGYPDALNYLASVDYAFPVPPPPTVVVNGGYPATVILPDDTSGAVDPTCPINWAHPLNIGRVAWWKVVANPGWRGGSTLRDLVRGGHVPNDGTLSGATKPVWGGPKGLPGSAGSLTFDGNLAFVRVTNTPAISPPVMSVSLWFYCTKTISVEQEQVSKVRSVSGYACGIYHSKWYFQLNANATFATGTAILSANRWYRAVATYDGVTIKTYLNGVLDSTATYNSTIGNSSSDLIIGRYDYISSQNYYGGYLDDISIWNRALSAQEVAADYKLSRQGYPGVLNYYLALADYSVPVSSSLAVSGGGGAYTATADTVGTLVDPTCPVNWAHPLNIGLVGWWKVVGNPGWRGGLTLRDLVRGGHAPNDGVLTGPAKPIWGGSRGLQGSQGTLTYSVNNYVDTGSNVIETGGQNISIAAWVRPTNSSSYPAILGRAGVFSESNAKYMLYFPSANLKPGFAMGGTINVSTVVVPANVWTHIAVTNSAAGCSIYVNGVAQTFPACPAPTYSTETRKIGQFFNAGSFIGQLDDVTLWNRALTSQEIVARYKLSRLGYPGVLNYLLPDYYPTPTASGTVYTIGGSGGILDGTLAGSIASVLVAGTGGDAAGSQSGAVTAALAAPTGGSVDGSQVGYAGTVTAAPQGGTVDGSQSNLLLAATWVAQGGVVDGSQGSVPSSALIAASGGSVAGSVVGYAGTVIPAPQGGVADGSQGNALTTATLAARGGVADGSQSSAATLGAPATVGGAAAGSQGTALTTATAAAQGGSVRGSQGGAVTAAIIVPSGGGVDSSQADAQTLHAGVVNPQGGVAVGSQGSPLVAALPVAQGGTAAGSLSNPRIAATVAPQGGTADGSSGNAVTAATVSGTGGSATGTQGTALTAAIIAPQGGSAVGSVSFSALLSQPVLVGGTAVQGPAQLLSTITWAASGGAVAGSVLTFAIVNGGVGGIFGDPVFVSPF